MRIYVLASKRLPSFKNGLCHNARTMLSTNKGRKRPYPQEMCNLKGCTPEMNIILQIKYTSISKQIFNKKIKGGKSGRTSHD